MNYILFFPDEMRAESLHCYGNTDAYTPNIDALAAEGTRFDLCYTAHPVCTASRISIMTGCYPHVHGYRSLKHFLHAGDHTFVNAMKEQGYTTWFAGKSDCWEKEGTEEAFDGVLSSLDWDFFDLEKTKQAYLKAVKAPKTEILPHEYTMLKEARPDEEIINDRDYQLVDWGCDRIREHRGSDQPFFLMLSLLAPHPAYQTFHKYDAMYDPGKLTPPRGMDWLQGKPAFYETIRKYRELEEEDESLFRKVYATYLAMYTYVDDLLGMVVNTLKECGIYEDTTIILCSDHGDFAGDAGLIEKWPSAMDDMLARVPLIIRHPGSPAGHTVKTPVQSIDIFPTIFGFEDLQEKHPHFGVSLQDEVEGGAGVPDRAVYCEGGYDTSEPHCFEGTPLFFPHMTTGSQYYPKMLQQIEEPDTVCRAVMQRDMRYKLVVRTNGQNELYDMEKDPMEYRNLYSDPAYRGIRDAEKDRMLSWLLHTSDVTPYEGHVLLGAE